MGDSFEAITARNRRHRLGLTLNNEYSEQVSEDEKVKDTQIVNDSDNENEKHKIENSDDSIELIDSKEKVVSHDFDLNDKEIDTLKSTLTNFKKLRYKKSSNFRSKFKNVNTSSSTIFDADYFKNSDFYGFYIIFWLATGFFIFNQVVHHYFNKNEFFLNGVIMNLFKKNLIIVALTDAIMYFSQFLVVFIQYLFKYQILSWSYGQFIQIGFEIGYMTFWLYIINTSSSFTWIARVFLVLNSLVYLMKIHSYGFYNGYLWTIYRELSLSESILKNLKRDENGEIIDHEIENQLIESIAFCTFELEYQSQVNSFNNDDAISAKIIDKIISNHHVTANHNDKTKNNPHYFPNNISLKNYFIYSIYPTVVYTLNFPKTKKIRWKFVFEKICGVFGIIILMVIVAENFMLPLIDQTIEIRKLPLQDRLIPFFLILLDMIPPFLFQYIFSFFLIWDQILNAIAELTRFADRDFYGPWWSSSDWSDFARLWNKPVHNFLLRHVYHSSISSIKVNKGVATFITFVISSIIHEVVMMCIFKTFRGYLFLLQMSQIPLVMISRTKYLRDKKVLGILICWIGFMTGPPIICTLYLIY